MKVLVIGVTAVSQHAQFEALRSSLGAQIAYGERGSPSQTDVAHADLILVEAGTDLGGAMELLRGLAENGPRAPIVILGAERPPVKLLVRVLSMGVRGWLPRSYGPELTVAALRLILLGGVHMPHQHPFVTPAPGVQRGPLSARQAQVLRAMGRGLTNKEIAEELGISVGTVKVHVHAILEATGTRNRMEAVLTLDSGSR